MASIGLVPQDLKFGGEPTRLVDRPPQRLPRVRDDPSRHRRRRRRSPAIGDHNLFMAYAHVAHDCHVGNHTIFGNARDARRPRDGRGLRQRQRVLRRAPVLPRRPARVHRRLLGRHQGRAAVREDGRQPRAHLRPQHDRPGPPRVLAGRDRQAAPRLPPSAALNTSRALAQIERDPTLQCAEVQYVVEFIRTSKPRRRPAPAEPPARRSRWTSKAGARPTRVTCKSNAYRSAMLLAGSCRRRGFATTMIARLRRSTPRVRSPSDGDVHAGDGRAERVDDRTRFPDVQAAGAISARR